MPTVFILLKLGVRVFPPLILPPDGPLTFVHERLAIDPSGSLELAPETVKLLAGRTLAPFGPALAVGDWFTTVSAGPHN